jgi:hypothetical protein
MAKAADTLPRGRYVVLDFTIPHAQTATFEEALGHAQREAVKNPQKRLAVLQVVAELTPIVSSKITRHRF